MVFLKSLFLAVYASNGGIRLLFLPLCYALLLSPFLLLFIRRFRVDSKALAYIPNDYKTPDILPQVFVSLIVVLLATRVISGGSNGASKSDGKRRVLLLPYWVPGVRHWGNIILGAEGWLKGVREASFTSIVAYNSAGAKHNIILSPPLLDCLVKNTNSLDEAELDKWIVLRNVFGMSESAKKQYLELRPAISETLEAEVFKGEQMKQLISKSLEILSESLPDLVTFNSSIVDQMPWERVAGLDLTDGTVEVECELFALINEFFCSAILPPITGFHFPESYQLLATDLATVNQSFYGLALGLPRLFPVPGLPTASLARKRLSQNLIGFFEDLTNPPVKRVVQDDESMSGEEDTDADVPTALTALNELFTKHSVPMPARAAITLELLHRVVSQAVPLAFWTLLHIYSASSRTADESKGQEDEVKPLVRIRGETNGWAEAIQPPSIHPRFPSPPAISFKSPTQALSTSSFPYLSSCISEAKRLYGASLATVRVTKPITTTETESARPGVQEQWELDVGSYIDIGLSRTLINTSSAHYLSPTQFKPDRFLHSPPEIKAFSDASEDLTNALIISLIAGITQLWDITAAPKKTFIDIWKEVQAASSGQEENSSQGNKERKVGVWVIPKAVDGAHVKLPKGEIRVRVKRREGLDEPKTMRKGR